MNVYESHYGKQGKLKDCTIVSQSKLMRYRLTNNWVLHKKAQAGDADARFELGLRKLFGVHEKKDPNQAISLLKQSAKQNQLASMYILSVVYGMGVNVEPDKLVSDYWITKLLSCGGLNVQSFIQILFNDGQTVSRLHYTFLRHQIQAKCHNNAASQYHLGKAYIDGTILMTDYPEAERWLKIASANRHTGARILLADFYADGCFYPPRIESALTLYRLAAHQGNPYAQYKYGLCCLHGLGRKVSIELAKRWLTQSAAQGYEKAKMELVRQG